MGLFTKKNKRKLLKTISIQGSNPEGSKDYVMIESLLTGVRLNATVPGTINAYNTYEAQIKETYRKYNSFASFGCQQTRAIVDLRTAFIAGEGISISAEKDQTAKWIESFIMKNNFNGNNFINAVKGSEMAGQSLFLMRPSYWLDDSFYIKMSRIPYVLNTPFRPVYSDNLIKDDIVDIQIKKEGMWISAGFNNFIYVRTGGDDANTKDPVTKVGVVLTDAENYDRATKDMRRTNHIFARITPVFNTDTDSEATALQKRLSGLKWKIGSAFIGKAKFKYEVPSTGTHANLTSELVSTIKTISSVTGVPVHWLGYVDLMSNRSTADSLYELIKNATINERSEWQNAIYNMIIKAQKMYIDSGGEGLSNLDFNFEVSLPLLDFSNFLERIRALSLAFGDRAISLNDYRNAVPGIDPLKTKKAVDKEDKEAQNELISMGINSKNNMEEEDEQDN